MGAEKPDGKREDSKKPMTGEYFSPIRPRKAQPILVMRPRPLALPVVLIRLLLLEPLKPRTSVRELYVAAPLPSEFGTTQPARCDLPTGEAQI